MAMPPIVSEQEWQQAREELLVAEKEVTRLNDAVAAKRRRLPMVAMNQQYAFEGPQGVVSLVDLFEGRDELVVYQFMDVGPDGFCPGCTNFSNNVVNLDAVRTRGITFATVTNMPLAQIERRKAEMGWSTPVYSSRGTTFSEDCGVGGGFGLSAFLRDGDLVYRTYTTMGRGVDHMLFDYNIADITAYGRKEAWEDSPEGWPQGPTYE
jgi:predicted dithiol-disulfide oxidoreductase (DUF899 family)